MPYKGISVIKSGFLQQFSEQETQELIQIVFYEFKQEVNSLTKREFVLTSDCLCFYMFSICNISAYIGQ